MKTIKHTLTSILLICLVTFTAFKASAQAPTITKTTGYPIGANVSCYGIAYGANKYVAIAYNGDIYTSADGDNWSKSASLGELLYQITYGNSLFVVSGANGYIATSTDAITWTQRATGTTNTLNDVQYLQNVFYAVGQNRTILSSTNGTTWSAVTVSSGTATDFLYQIVYGGGKYIIIGSAGPSGPITYQSTTGASSSWSAFGGFGVFGNTGLNKIAYLNSQFILITSSTAIFTSSNGTSWSNITSSMTVTNPNSTTAAVGNGNYFNNVYYNSGTYYWVGYSTYNGGAYGAIFTSSNLTALTLQANPINIVANKSYYLNGKHFIAGNEGFATSTNGTAYTFPYGSFNSLAFNGTTYVGVGAASTLSGVVFSSTTFNSNTWVNRSLTGQRPLYGVVHDGSKFVAVGDKTVISSTDGNTWSSLATPTDVFACLAYGGSKYVVGGYAPDYSSYFLKYSSNGITWTTANSASVTYFKVRYLNGAFFAVGIDNNYPASSGIIMSSTDGVNWNNVTPTGLSFNVYCFNDVTWDGTKYHFIGAEGDPSYAFFTLSTATPSTRSSYANKGTINNVPSGVSLGSSYGEGCISYNNGKFVGAVIDNSSYQAYLIYSTNGTSWTSVATNDKSVVYDAIVDNGVFRMVGTGDEKITVSFAPTNTSPTFSNATNTLSVCQNAAATSINSLLQITDADASQTETFSVTTAPNHGGSITSGTTVVSGANVSPTGWSYTPANGYSGTETFTIQVSDGTATASKTITVTVNAATTTGSVTTSICQGGAYTWPANGQSYSTAQSGVTVISGCNTATLNLTIIQPTSSGSVTTSICQGQTYTWPANGQTYSTAQSGVTFITGCNTATLNLTIKQPTSSTFTISACGSYTWAAKGNKVYTASNNTDTIHLTNADGCDSLVTLDLTIVNASNAGTISGGILCPTTNQTYVSNGDAGGVWSSSDLNVATINASTGVVHSLSAGSTTLSYTISNSTCGDAIATKTVTVNQLPNAGTISGGILCPTTNQTYVSNGDAGGVWSSSDLNVATIDASTGVVHSLSAGTTTLVYNVGNICGTSTATKLVTVNQLPNAGTISGSSSVCVNNSINLTATGSTGGTWNTDNSIAVSVNNGQITGLAAGTATIAYTVTNICGTATATKVVTVGSATTSNTNLSVCNNQIPYSWNGLTFSTASSQTAHLTNAAGCDSAATLNLTITSLSTPTISVVADGNNVCTGIPITFTATPSNGGTAPTYQWKKNGVNVGTNINTYFSTTLNNNDSVWCVLTSNSACATTTTAISNKTKMLIKAAPSAPIIQANSVLLNCTIGGNTTMACNYWGTTWSSSNPSVATVNYPGPAGTNGTYINGVSNGSTIITVTVVNGLTGCSSTASVNYVVAAANAGTITVANGVCLNKTITATSNVAGGVWSFSNNKALVNTSGVLTGNSVGSGVLSYKVTNAQNCSATATANITTYALPVAPTVSSLNAAKPYCKGATYNVTASPTTGAWTTSNASTSAASGSPIIVTLGNTVGAASLTYTITDVNGCTANRVITATVGNCVGSRAANVVTQSTHQQINLYPNPAKGVVRLQVDKMIGEGTVVITDVYGKVVYSSIVNSALTTVDISHFGKGLYLVSMITNDGKTTKKLIVE